MVSENDESAKDLIYDKYKPIIISMACKYSKIGKGLGLELDDFIQEGYFGLFQALSNYSDNKDCLFYTYALRSISSKMHNLCVVNNTKKKQALNNSISLNTTVNDEGDSSLLELIEDKKSPNPWFMLDNYDLYKALRDNIYNAPLIEGAILELKLNGFSIASISELLGETRHFVSNTLVKIKSRLKNSLR